MAGLREEELEILKEAFNIYDKDGDGKIKSSELGAVIRSLGKNPSQAEIKDFVMELDANNSGHIEYHDFINLMVKLDKEPPTENEQLLRKWLGIFDKDNDGIIDNHELTQVLKTLGESLSQQEADAMIKTLDPSNSGRVHIDSAIKVLLSKA